MKKKLTVEGHLRLARHLRAIREEIFAIRELIGGCQLISTVGTSLYAAENRLQQAKSALDSVLVMDHGDDPRVSPDVYYGRVDPHLTVPAAEEAIETATPHEPEPDGLDAFLAERCENCAGSRVASIDFYHAYTRWAEQNGAYPMSHKAFASRLSARNFQKRRTASGATYFGVNLLTPAQAPA